MSTLNPATITGRINAQALELLDASPEGIRWTDLSRLIKEHDSAFHPKTVNGCVWKLVENFPDRVFKPEKGLFRSRRYEDKT
jgi:hypothetical protein